MIRIDDLKKSYGTKLLFDGATYHFPEGERIALVGANGAGKTTLLRVIADEEAADEGSVLKPARVTLGYLPQNPNPNHASTIVEECIEGADEICELKKLMDAALKKMEETSSTPAAEAYDKAESSFRIAGGYALAARTKTILAGLGFKEEIFENSPSSLSSGWRMRLELARLFNKNPDFMLLDEPTNHLDLPSLVWMEQYLKSYKGTLVFVTHDRLLINRLASITLHLSGGRLRSYPGNFDQFLAAKEMHQAHEQAKLAQLKRKQADLERFVTRFGAKATKATQAQSRVKMISKLRALEDDLDIDRTEETVAIHVPKPIPSHREVFRIENGQLGYDSALCDKIDFVVSRGQKIAVIGANGIGKSTLLKTLSGKIPSWGGEFFQGEKTVISYFAQEAYEDVNPDLTVLENVLQSPEITEKEARGLLGSFLFRGDDVFKETSVLSGGETRRVGLACALSRPANFLLLDEPTNHLDMSSTESLVSALNEYQGTLLFVSHDRLFIDSICTHVFAMLEDGRSMLFEGKLDDYERLSNLASFPNVLDPELSLSGAGEEKSEIVKTGATVQREQTKDLKRRARKIERDKESTEKQMAALQSKIDSLESEVAALPTDDYEKSAELLKKIAVSRDELGTKEEEWLAVSEELEALHLEMNELGIK